jgi:dolichol-phosphate mannosyltransferase
LKNILVFTATYNEAENVPPLVRDVFAILPDCDMLVVDDNSPDGTGRILDELKQSYPRLHVVHRPGKNGLGTAHKLAIKFALAKGYDALITMDADFSHDPKYLPEMVRNLEASEFVIGSRFVAGGSCGYPLPRQILTHTANGLTRNLLGIPLGETTTSYRGFRRSLLERMNVDAIRSDGYSFFVEAILQVSRLARAEGSRDAMREFPIRFEDRRAGSTKISKKEIWNGFATLARLSVKRALGKARPTPPIPEGAADTCGNCGCAYAVEEGPASQRSGQRMVRCLSCDFVHPSPASARDS